MESDHDSAMIPDAVLACPLPLFVISETSDSLANGRSAAALLEFTDRNTLCAEDHTIWGGNSRRRLRIWLISLRKNCCQRLCQSQSLRVPIRWCILTALLGLLLGQVAGFLLATEQFAHAYTDPGSAFLALQIFGASLAGWAYFTRRKLRSFFSNFTRQRTSVDEPIETSLRDSDYASRNDRKNSTR